MVEALMDGILVALSARCPLSSFGLKIVRCPDSYSLWQLWLVWSGIVGLEAGGLSQWLCCGAAVWPLGCQPVMDRQVDRQINGWMGGGTGKLIGGWTEGQNPRILQNLG